MPWIDSLDYLDLNSLRRYPIREGSSVTSTDELFQIPDSLIVDMSISASTNPAARFYISAFFNNLFSCTIQIAEYASGTIVGSFFVDFNSHKLNDTYYLTPIGTYAGSTGKITIGTGDDLQLQPAGQFAFLNTSTELETRTIVPGLQGVSSITYLDADGNTGTFTGDITMNARTNMTFTYDTIKNSVAMDVGDNLGLNQICTKTNCIQKINGVTPDPASGNLTLIGVDCMQISSGNAYTLQFNDSCCTPCSGCTDLSTLTTRLTSLENSFIDLKNYYNTLNGQLVSYLTTVNSSCSCGS
jgi:hypothetical protein